MPTKFMSGVWVAFEDIDENNGPLYYYPGSHRGPVWGLMDTGIDNNYLTYSEKDAPQSHLLKAIVDQQGVEPELFKAKAGDAVIWAANLYHGGMKINKKGATRYSMVTHYFYEGTQYFSRIHSNVGSRNIKYLDFDNMINGEKVKSPRSLLPQPPIYKKIYYSIFKSLSKFKRKKETYYS